MALRYAPKAGTIVTADYSRGFVAPEMVKRRLAVVIAPPMKARPGLCTVVPLSTSPPSRVMDYHAEIDIPFELAGKFNEKKTKWVKGDMINAVGFHRLDLMCLGKDETGKRIYQKECLPDESLLIIRKCVLSSLGLGYLTHVVK